MVGGYGDRGLVLLLGMLMATVIMAYGAAAAAADNDDDDDDSNGSDSSSEDDPDRKLVRSSIIGPIDLVLKHSVKNYVLSDEDFKFLTKYQRQMNEQS